MQIFMHRLRRISLSTSWARRAFASISTPQPAYATELQGEVQDEGLNPYRYTSGRWLKNDKTQQQARHVRFDFSALCAKAIQACPGASRIVKQEKKEGTYNRAFLFQMDNDARVVARIPFQFSGPRRLKTNSEVATMAYIRTHTTISVPIVLDWSDDSTNSAGIEYIIMEHAAGVHLYEKWNEMSFQQQISLVKSAANIVKEMAKLEFPIYGSLYFTNAPIDPALKLNLCENFCIGPHCGTQYWCCEPGESRSYDRRKPNRGPWLDLKSFCSALIDIGFSRIQSQDHIHLLNVSEQVCRELIKTPIIQNISRAVLLHSDLHRRNIFVSNEDPSSITAVIDWQSTSIQPVFSFTEETPDMIADPLIDIAITEAKSDDPCKQAGNPDAKKEFSTTFETVLKQLVPELHNARALDSTFLRPITYSDKSWKDGIAPFRQELIKLSRRWNELGLPDFCPYMPSQEELSRHKEESEGYKYFQKLNLYLSRVIGSSLDGWVPHEDWEAAKDINNRLFEHWLKVAAEIGDTDVNREQVKRQWPFDVDIND